MKRNFVLALMVFLFLSCNTSRQVQVVTKNAPPPVVRKGSGYFYSGNNFLRKNDHGLWELYVEGDPVERGLATGSLTDSLIREQQRIFFDKIDDWIPSKLKQRMLQSVLKFFNRKLDRNIPEEYKAEIYALSEYSSKDLDNIAPRYQRSLYLHAAHDIGHAFHDLALVGCSSFAVKGEKSDDGNLIVGRNFDFYVSDEFSKNKIISFVNPDKGYPFMMVTWPGMIGAVSGMNREGLSVTINAAKSKIPFAAKTPISILTREILQYAKNIEEAVAIAKKRSVFVSESILVGSAHDNNAVIIEVSPRNFGLYEMEENQIICSNHFQSETYGEDKRNRQQIKNSHSVYRYNRMIQLLKENKKMNPAKTATVLRNKEGLDGIPLGYGNEKALNQLLAHHAVIFKPAQRLVWVSASHYQLGAFICYDLNKVFKDSAVIEAQQHLNIPEDSFLTTAAYQQYEKFRAYDRSMDACLERKSGLMTSFIEEYQSSNPDYWKVYYKVGLYFYRNREYQLARDQFRKALTKEITTLPEHRTIERYIKKLTQ
jgi:predicted choloylglycine hydrolase